MIKNEYFICYSNRVKCYITNGVIKPYPFSSDNLMLGYNPFNESNYTNRPLYILFSEIKTEDDIVDFISQYGFLGLHFESLKNKNWLEYLKSVSKSSDFLQNYSESVEEFMNEVHTMSALLELIKSFNDVSKEMDLISSSIKDKLLRSNELSRLMNSEVLKDSINNVYRYNGRSLETDFGNDTMPPRIIAADLISLEIERRLETVLLKPVYSISEKAFIESRTVINLITAMYLMLYEDLVSHKRFALCENRTCNRWFIIDTRHAKKFCCSRCEVAEKQRRYRKNKKRRVNNNGRLHEGFRKR